MFCRFWIYIQVVSNSTLTIGISETIEDTKVVKLGQSCAFMCSTKCRLESLKIPSNSGDIRKKTKFWKIVLFFSYLYFLTNFKINKSFTLPLFPLYRTVLIVF